MSVATGAADASLTLAMASGRTARTVAECVRMASIAKLALAFDTLSGRNWSRPSDCERADTGKQVCAGFMAAVNFGLHLHRFPREMRP